MKRGSVVLILARYYSADENKESHVKEEKCFEGFFFFEKFENDCLECLSVNKNNTFSCLLLQTFTNKEVSNFS